MLRYIFFYLILFCSVVNAQINSNQYLVTSAGTLNNAYIFTVEFWVKTNDNRSNDVYWQRPYLFGNENNGDNSGDFGITMNNGYIGMWEGISSLNKDQQFLSNSIRINDNFWHHIAAVNNGQTLNLYVDGNIAGSLVSGRTLNTYNAPLTFGAASSDHNFPGNLNNTNFHSQAIFGEARISKIARYTVNFTPDNNYVSDDNTIAIYHFNKEENFNNANSNVAITADPNFPVIFDADQPINNSYAQPATLFINDSTFLNGRLLLAKKDWSFNNEIGIHFFEGSSKKATFYRTTEIKGFKMGTNYFVPKFLAQGGPISTPSAKTIVRLLTPQGSKMNIYEYIAKTSTKNSSGIVQYQTTIVHLVELPNSTDDMIYQYGDNKFVPHFDTRVSAMVADKPALAEKIKSKGKDYFYAQLTEASHQEKVWWNIVNEYNQP